MIRFYSPDIEDTLSLPETESAHCCRVLRLREGDKINVVDGKGNEFICTITDADHRSTSVEIVLKRSEPRHWDVEVTLAVAPTKNIDRMEWMLEKATEIGVDRIVFLKCARSERKEIKDERLRKILVSAMKQSMKATLPDFAGMMKFADFIATCGNADKFMGYCSEAYPRKEFVKEYTPQRDAVILIGPEGDFSEEEVAEAVNAGFIPVTFGDTRLRTETAALYSLAALHTINQLDRWTV